MRALDSHRSSLVTAALVTGALVFAMGRPVIVRARPQTTGSVGGRVTFEGAAAPRPSDVSRVMVIARPVQSAAAVVQTTARADGAFEFASLEPGRYRITAVLPQAATPAPAGPGVARWNLKSALLDGADVVDIPFEVRAGDKVVSLTVAMSDWTTDFSGALLDAEGRPVAGRTVIVFASDSRFWFAGSRRLPLPARSNDNGAFHFAGLPPGEYRIAALADAAVSTVTEAFLTQLGQRSVAFVLGIGETKVLNLQVGR